MSFIKNDKLASIRTAARNGDEKAKMVLQALRKGDPQDALDGLVNDFFGVGASFQEQQTYGEPKVDATIVNDMQIDAIKDNFTPPQAKNDAPAVEPQSEEQIPTQSEEIAPQLGEAEDLGAEQPSEIIEPEQQPEVSDEMQQGDVADLTELLDGETADLFDENEIDDISFTDFLGNQKKNRLREKKNADYFKAFDLQGRTNYMDKKIGDYTAKFDNRRKDIDRRYNDIGKSIDLYSTKANEMLDDDMEFDMDKATSAYGDFIGNENTMHSFGRHWDDADSNEIINALHELMGKYGKKNVIAALNSLKNDNETYKGFLNGQIDTEIGRYSKSVENLLK